MNTSQDTLFSWKAHMGHWEQLVKTAVQPQEVLWSALRALVPTVCQGENAWHRMQMAPPETLIAAPRGWAFTHTSGLQIRRSFQGGMRVMIPVRGVRPGHA